MSRRPLPHGLDRASLTREIEPIMTQADAQAYGSNVDCLVAAREQRSRDAWEAAVRSWTNPEPEPCPTLDDIMRGPPRDRPDGNDAA